MRPAALFGIAGAAPSAYRSGPRPFIPTYFMYSGFFGSFQAFLLRSTKTDNYSDHRLSVPCRTAIPALSPGYPKPLSCSMLWPSASRLVPEDKTAAEETRAKRQSRPHLLQLRLSESGRLEALPGTRQQTHSGSCRKAVPFPKGFSSPCHQPPAAQMGFSATSDGLKQNG